MAYKFNPITGQLDYYESGYTASTITDPYIDIRAYGAVDGQDSSTAINAAITAATAGAWDVLIPEGTFIIDATINLANNVRLKGVGSMSILQAKTGLNAAVISVSTKDKVILENFKIDGNRANQSSVSAHGILFSGVTNSVISKMYVTACYGHGIFVGTSSSKIDIVDNYIYDTGITYASNPPRGLWVSASNKIIVDRNTITGCQGFAFTASAGSTEFTLSNNILQDSVEYDGALIYGCSHFSVNGNIVKGNFDSGIVFELCNYFSGVNNNIQTSGYAGIYLQGSTYGTVIGNSLKDNGANAHATYCHDIIITPSGVTNSTYNSIIGNTCRTTAGITKYGIQEFNSSQDYNTIVNNVCIGQIIKGVSQAGLHSQVNNNVTNDTTFTTFTNADTTPSVGIGTLFKCSNTATTIITNFDDGYAGKEIEIIFTNGNTTLNDTGNIVLTTTPITPLADNTFRFRSDGTNWYQIGGIGGNNVDGGLIGESSTNVNIVDGGLL